MNAPQNVLDQYESDTGPARALTADRAHEHATRLSRFFGKRRLMEKMGIYNMSLIILLMAMMVLELVALFYPAWKSLAQNTALVLTVCGTAWVLYVHSVMRREIADPVFAITGEMTRLSQGARDIVISGQRRQDEIGELARSLDAFTKDYKRLDTLLAERDAHDALGAEKDAQRKQDLLKLAAEFESSIGEIASSVASAATQLNATAADMAKTAHGSSEAAQSVADAMKRASDVATAAAAASDEFALSIDEISRQATQSEQLARNAASSADGTDTNISALSDSTEEISQVLDLIQTIANRTNLLALNASIEAARGGDSGRGFAVVASEVKELAHQTSAATSKVGSQIETMQGSTKSSVEQLRKVAKHIHDLERTSVSIASAVDQQSVAGKELARNIDMSARETGEVASYAKDLLEKATGVGSAADQLLESSKELDRQAGRLTAQAEGFIKRIRQN